MKTSFLILGIVFLTKVGFAQGTIVGKVSSENNSLELANIVLLKTKIGTTTDTAGIFMIEDIPEGTYTLKVTCIGYKAQVKNDVVVRSGEDTHIDFELIPQDAALDEVVVTGTLKEVSRLESPVNVEVYTPVFFRKNPTPSIFDALQHINGVRPQLNCNICNTGDIHINGLEGPYTMVMIDGMPIVSSLSTVYGLSGIPNSLIERVEIVKGPASSLYGSEAVAGLVNIITKKPETAPAVTADGFATSWQEYNTDLGFKFNAGKKAAVLTGLNYYKYNNPLDENNDRFTDVTLQDRISVFQKWSFTRKEKRSFSVAGRYYYENRWGGEMNWNSTHRGGDDVYGESIYTKRWELIGNYQLPVPEKLMFSFSYNHHDQNSVYGTTRFLANQHIGFGQLTWDKKLHKHDFLAGVALRYTFYDDNTPATKSTQGDVNRPDRIWLPGLFLQDEISLAEQHNLLLGMRYDNNSVHGNIFTPRVAYKWKLSDVDIIRLNAGTGYRVVNLFTEDHAALTGAREVVITEDLEPEKTYNLNLNYIKKIYVLTSSIINLDASAWYTRFNNRIIADYDTDPNKIIYANLKGTGVSRGVSLNVDLNFSDVFKVIAGGSLMDVSTVEEEAGAKVRKLPVLTERWTGTWSVSYKMEKLNLNIDYTGNVYGPMRLPVLGDLDPRSESSKAWSLQNIQFTFSGKKGYEIYGGVKNLLNWTPAKNTPFLIARTNDPFDKNVTYDPSGQVVATPDNPYALTFDPSYVYAPNQGIRGFLGVRMILR